jgi:predicted Zn finger-like uncharacterized protein
MIIACPRCNASYAVDAVLFGSQRRSVQCSACSFRWQEAPHNTAERDTAQVCGTDRVQAAVADSPGLPDRGPEEGTATADALAKPPLPAPVQPSVVQSPGDDEQTYVAGGDAKLGGESDIDRTKEAAPNASPHATLGEGDEAEIASSQPQDRKSPGEDSPRLLGRRAFVAGTAALATLTTLASLLLLVRETVVARLPQAARLYDMIGLASDPLGAGLEIRDVKSVREEIVGEEVLAVEGVIANVGGQRVPLPPLRVSLYDMADEELQSVTVAHASDSLDAGESVRFEASIHRPGPDARRLRVRFTASPP